MARSEVAVLGGGCFWCLEAVYQQMEGVLSVESGYMGGRRPNPTYQQVCSGATGHVEVVQVTFDPDVTPYREILEVFFAFHDPTTRDRQGNDVGSQYRSVIFYTSAEQQATAEQLIRELGTPAHLVRPHRDRGPAGFGVLSGGRLPSELFPHQSGPALLLVCGSAQGQEVPRQIQTQTQTDCGATALDERTAWHTTAHIWIKSTK